MIIGVMIFESITELRLRCIFHFKSNNIIIVLLLILLLTSFLIKTNVKIKIIELLKLFCPTDDQFETENQV